MAPHSGQSHVMYVHSSQKWNCACWNLRRIFTPNQVSFLWTYLLIYGISESIVRQKKTISSIVEHAKRLGKPAFRLGGWRMIVCLAWEKMRAQTEIHCLTAAVKKLNKKIRKRKWTEKKQRTEKKTAANQRQESSEYFIMDTTMLIAHWSRPADRVIVVRRGHAYHAHFAHASHHLNNINTN